MWPIYEIPMPAGGLKAGETLTVSREVYDAMARSLERMRRGEHLSAPHPPGFVRWMTLEEAETLFARMKIAY